MFVDHHFVDQLTELTTTYMSSKNIIFHHPLPLTKGGLSASRIRPYQILNAFDELGYTVFPVVGYNNERKQSIARIKQLSKDGKKFDFLYSELTTSPLPTNDPHNLPLYPNLDFSFFNWFRDTHGKVGAFYRDAHWRFPFYGQNLNVIKKNLALMLYRFEARKLSKSIDHLFLPSEAIKTYLPENLQNLPITITPPGTKLESPPQKVRGKVKLLYSGAINPPIYDIATFVSEIASHPALSLTLCTREDEWRSFKNNNNYKDSKNIKVLFKNNQELSIEFKNHDFFVIPIAPNPYFNMAMPMKLFDAISYNLPLLSLEGSSSSRFITENQIGWSFKDTRELINSIEKIPNSQIDQVYNNLEKVRIANTWTQRVKDISQKLTQL